MQSCFCLQPEGAQIMRRFKSAAASEDGGGAVSVLSLQQAAGRRAGSWVSAQDVSERCKTAVKQIRLFFFFFLLFASHDSCFLTRVPSPRLPLNGPFDAQAAILWHRLRGWEWTRARQVAAAATFIGFNWGHRTWEVTDVLWFHFCFHTAHSLKTHFSGPPVSYVPDIPTNKTLRTHSVHSLSVCLSIRILMILQLIINSPDHVAAPNSRPVTRV